MSEEIEKRKMEIGKIEVEAFFWEDDSSWPAEVSLSWSEQSPDSYFSDNDVDIDLPRDEAIELINFLKKNFKISEDELELAKIK